MECIHSILEHQTALRTDLPAVKFGPIVLSYNEFNILVNQFSHCLTGIGVHRDVCVGLAMERSFEMVIAIFAILKAGGAYVPVDPEYPDERIRFIFGDASVNILITQEKFAEKFENYPQQILKPDISDWAFKDFPGTNPAVQVAPNDLAYILFTSGSTGKPKGVMVEHHSVVNLITCIQRLYPIGTGDNVLLKSPYTFDGSVWELYGWLIPGGCLYVAGPGVEKDPALLLKVLISNEISFTFFVSSMLSAFLEYIEISGSKVVADKLKWVSVGGEVVSPSLVRRFYREFGKSGIGLFNVYGPTETTVYATTFLCLNEDSEKIPVGMAVDHDFVYVLDESMNPVDPMQEGEIFIGGEGVARGYLNRPELDTVKFIRNPFREDEKMYATGDIGRFLPDGNLDFIGRRDFQIKMRGLRIELGEIENSLVAVPGIREAAVIFTRDNLNDDSLIAFLVPEPDSGITTGEDFMLAQQADKERINKALHRLLPDFMIPSEMVICRIFPVTENGKLDRRRLKLPVTGDKAIPDNFVFPSTATEAWLAEVWREVLSVDKISIHDNFFRLGGHSLKAVRIAARITGKSGMEMPIRTIFGHPTIGKLAEIIDSRAHSGISIQPGMVQAERHQNGFPLNANQLELWFLHKMDVTRTQHNILFRLDITGNPDIRIFEAAVNTLIDANESLRTSIIVRDGVPLQFLCAPYELKIPVVNLLKFDQNDKDQRLDAAGKTIGKQLFDLESGRLFSFNWFVVSEQSHVVFFCIHHIIFDGWSMFNFFNGLKMAYLNVYNGLQVALPKNGIQNIDFAVYEQKFLQQERFNNQLDYWKSVFCDLPPKLILNSRKPFILNDVAITGKRVWWKMPATDFSALKSFTETHDCSLFSVLLTVYKLMLCNFSGNLDIAVGTPYANRKRQETESLIGYFTNMMALRSRISKAETFTSLLKRVQMTSLDAFANADLPFGRLVRSLGLITSPGNYPLFQAVFVMQNWAMPDMEFAGLILTQKELGSGGVKAELMLNAEETGNELEFWIEYDVSLYDEPSVFEMVTYINETIRSIVDHPDILVERLLVEDPSDLFRGRIAPACLLIGETGLLIECGELLLKNGFLLTGLISPDPACISWGKAKGIGFIAGYGDIPTTDWNVHPYDYLFSIVNSKILKPDMLGRAARYCINYHDSLLPHYAGVHATSWALMNGEKMHGISWHLMTADADAGVVIASFPVAIEEEDTAYTLNARCFEAAIQSFQQVIAIMRKEVNLSGSSVKPVSYFGLYQKPFAAAILDFRMKSQKLCDLVRALYLGENINNTLASPKLITAKGAFLVQRASFSVIQTGKKPGTILELSAHEVSIATQDGVMKVKELLTLSGMGVEVHTVFQKADIKTMLPVPDAEQLLLVDQQTRLAAPNEGFWIKELSLVADVIEPVQPHAIGPVTTLEIPVAGIGESDFNAALIFFLACYSNSASISVGISSGNICKIFDQSFGVFADVIPFSMPPVAGMTCDDALAELNRKIAGSFSRGSYLFDLISRTPELKRKFAGTGNPEYTFILTNSADSARSVGLRYPGATIFIPGADHVTIISGDRVLIDNCTTRMPLFFQQLNAHRHDAVSTVNMLTLAELNIHLHLNDPWDLIGVIPFLQLFNNQVKDHPEKTAIEFDNTIISYKELSHRSDDVAGMIPEGNNRGSHGIVGICLDRNPDFLVAILGILKSGNAWLPLDPGIPAERLKAILLDSGVSHVISTEKYYHLIPDSVMILDAGTFPDRESGFRESSLSGDGDNRAAYVIYTSGTSGKPKGVVITNRSLDIFIHGSINRYSLTTADRVLQFASLAFDASVEEIFPTLACGATLVMRTNDSITGMNRFLDFCQDKNISVLNLPTAFWHQMMDYQAALVRVPDKLRLVIIGGERARMLQVSKWLHSQWNQLTLVNTYGPTETTVVATAYNLPPGNEVEELPVGKPVFGAKARVLNVFSQTGIPGRPNELLIGGEIVSSGYLHRDELNEKSFILMGEGAEQVRFYRTGDLVTIQPDGNMMFAGRIDEQLKIRGFRVEVSEIESAINQLPVVDGCVVVPFKNANKEISLAAYVVFRKGVEAAIPRQLLSSVLPDYMIPAQFIGIPFIPLTINNKIDLRALPEPGGQQEVMSDQQPVTEMEKMVFSAWAKQLGTGNFGVDHDFFKLGGHSLMALAVMNEIETLTGRTIPLASLFSFPTVKTLAAALEADKEREGWRPLVCIKPGSGRMPLFIIHGGGLNVMLFNTLAQKMAPGQPVYGIQAHGLDGKSTPYEHIDDIATHYMREIRSVLPYGPYALAGFSIGGLIAHELCCRFEELGEPVAFLGMFDTEAILNESDLTEYQRKLLHIKESLLHILFNFKVILTDPVHTIPKKFKWLKYRVKMKFLNQRAINREDLVDLPSNLIYVAKANIKAISALNLRHYSGTLHLFRAGKRNFYVSDPVFLGWKKYAGEVAVYPIPGDHSMIFAPPNDTVFAEKLQAALDNAQPPVFQKNLAHPDKP